MIKNAKFLSNQELTDIVLLYGQALINTTSPEPWFIFRFQTQNSNRVHPSWIANVEEDILSVFAVRPDISIRRLGVSHLMILFVVSHCVSG